MAFVACKKCEQDVNDLIVKCPYCGVDLKAKTRLLLVIIILIVATILVMEYFYLKERMIEDMHNNPVAEVKQKLSYQEIK